MYIVVTHGTKVLYTVHCVQYSSLVFFFKTAHAKQYVIYVLTVFIFSEMQLNVVLENARYLSPL